MIDAANILVGVLITLLPVVERTSSKPNGDHVLCPIGSAVPGTGRARLGIFTDGGSVRAATDKCGGVGTSCPPPVIEEYALETHLHD